MEWWRTELGKSVWSGGSGGVTGWKFGTKGTEVFSEPRMIEWQLLGFMMIGASVLVGREVNVGENY